MAGVAFNRVNQVRNWVAGMKQALAACETDAADAEEAAQKDTTLPADDLPAIPPFLDRRDPARADADTAKAEAGSDATAAAGDPQTKH
jgi:hypothetical protein